MTVSRLLDAILASRLRGCSLKTPVLFLFSYNRPTDSPRQNFKVGKMWGFFLAVPKALSFFSSLNFFQSSHQPGTDLPNSVCLPVPLPPKPSLSCHTCLLPYTVPLLFLSPPLNCACCPGLVFALCSPGPLPQAISKGTPL